MKFRHLPVLSNTDITHNFEQLQSKIDELEIQTQSARGSKGAEGKEGKSSSASKSFIATEQESTSASGTPELLATPDRVEVVLATDSLVTIWVRLEMKRVEAGQEAQVYVYIDGNVAKSVSSAAGGSVGAAYKGRTEKNKFLTFVSDQGSRIERPPEEAAAEETTLLGGAPLVLPLTAGTRKIELRMAGKTGKYKNRELWVTVN